MSSKLNNIRLGDIATFVNGRAYKNTEFKTSGIPIVRIQNLTGGGRLVYSDLTLPEDKYIEKGDLIYAWSATFGPYIWKGKKSIYHYHIWKILPNSNTDKHYLYYLLKQISSAISNQGTGSIFSHITKGLMESYQVSVHEYSEQFRIGSLLWSLDAKIDKNDEINQTLEQMAQALYKSWFVDFEPVKAKLAALEAGGSQEDATLAAMTVISEKDADSLAIFEREHPEKYAELRATAELFPSAMQENESGEIPIGWFCTDLSYLALLNTSSWSKKNAPETLKYVDLANTKWGIIHSTEDFLFSDAPSRARRILKPGDTIVGTVRPGNGSYAFVAEDDLTGSTGFAVLTPKHEHFSSFIYICATSKDNIERLAHLADGGAYPAVNADVVLSTPCIIPVEHNSSKDLIACFHHYVRELFAYKHSNLRQNKSLEQLRDTLLPKLLSGEITLPDAEEIAKEADYV